MGRLTIKNEIENVDGIKYLPNNMETVFPILNKLGELEDLEEQGLLLKLPYKVGDVVYSAEYEEVKAYTVTSIRVHETAIYAYNHHFCIGEVGMSVFPTKAEAEKALEEMEK